MLQPGAIEPGGPRAAGVDAAGAGLRARGVLGVAAPAARAPRGQGVDHGAFTGAARPTRRRPRRRCGRSPRRERGRLQRALGPQGARGPPAGADRQGRGDRAHSCATGERGRTRCTWATTPPTSTRSAGWPSWCEAGLADQPRCAWGCAPTRDAGGARATRPTCWWTAGRRAPAARVAAPLAPSTVRFIDFLKATVLISAGAATAPGRDHGRARRARLRDPLVYVAAGWWLAAA